MPKLPRAPDPARLKGLEPELRELPREARFWRVYFRAGPHATTWHRFRHAGPSDTRFEHHLPAAEMQKGAPARAILYAAEHPYTCLAEVFQRTRVIDRWRADPWLVCFELARPLVALNLTGSFPTRAGASMALMTGPRSVARSWARGFYGAYPEMHGLCYPSSMHANAPAIALNERAERLNAVRRGPAFHRALGDPALLTVLRNAARELGYGLR